MPRKTGVECLSEITGNSLFNRLPVVIFSTSFDLAIVSQLYEQGAYCYIRKPGDFSQLKRAIHEAITIITQKPRVKPEKENFVIEV